MVYHRILNIVPYAKQQDLVALSILCALPCIFEPQPSTLSVYQSLPTGNHKYILYVRESVSCMRAKSF